MQLLHHSSESCSFSEFQSTKIRIVKTTVLDPIVSHSLLLDGLAPCWCWKNAAFTFWRLADPPKTSETSRRYYYGNVYYYNSNVSAMGSVLTYLEVNNGWESFLCLTKFCLRDSLEQKVNFVWSQHWLIWSEVPEAERLQGLPNCGLAKWYVHEEQQIQD